jgi:hypothetical protein
MKAVVVLPAIVLLAAVVLQTSAGAQPASTETAQTVTLAVERFYDKSTKLHHFFFTGAVSSRTAGEYVAVLYRRCGQSFSTAVAGATTQGNGVWAACEVVSTGRGKA